MFKKAGRKYKAISREEVERHLAEKVRSWNGLLDVLSRGVGGFTKIASIPIIHKDELRGFLHPVDPNTLKPLGHFEWQVEVGQLDNGQSAVLAVFYRGHELHRNEALEALAEMLTKRDRYPRRVRVPYERVPDRDVLWAMRQDKYGQTSGEVA